MVFMTFAAPLGVVPFLPEWPVQYDACFLTAVCLEQRGCWSRQRGYRRLQLPCEEYWQNLHCHPLESAVEKNLSHRANGDNRYLTDGRGGKHLPGKTGVHRHDKHKIYQLAHIFEGGEGGCRVQRHSRLNSVGANEAEHTVEMPCGLGMYRDGLNPYLCQSLDKKLVMLHHEMDIEGKTG